MPRMIDIRWAAGTEIKSVEVLAENARGFVTVRWPLGYLLDFSRRTGHGRGLGKGWVLTEGARDALGLPPAVGPKKPKPAGPGLSKCAKPRHESDPRQRHLFSGGES